MLVQTQVKSAIQLFHHKVVTQLTQYLKRYHNPKSNTIPNNNPNNVIHYQDQPQPQYFTANQITLFFYDILELQNSSIDFIMRDIFDSEKKSQWHIQEILRTVLDVQFVITVNNSIVAMNQNILTMNQNNKNKQKQISFIKIYPNDLVQMIYQNCFFLQNSPNSISKQLIHSIVQQINSSNGNKGHILLVQYKAFMLNNVVEKHNIRKFHAFSPHKSKPFTPINKDKYNQNSQSIKEVDEESQAMGRSNRNFSTISFREHQIQLDQYSKIKGSQIKQNLLKDIQDHSVSVNEFQQPNNINEFKQTILSKFHQQLWTSVNSSMKEIIKNQCNSLMSDINNEQFINVAKLLIQQKLTKWNPKYILKLNTKIYKLSFSTRSNDQQIGLMIRLIGEQAFKIYHDQIIINPPKHHQIPYFLSSQQLSTILLNSYGNLIQCNEDKQMLQQIAVELISQKGQQLINQKGTQLDGINQKAKHLSFKDLLNFFKNLSQPLTY